MSNATYRKIMSRAMRLARVAAGKTQGELAAALGVTQAQVSRMESGENPWTVEAMGAACRFLGIAASDVTRVLDEHQPTVPREGRAA